MAIKFFRDQYSLVGETDDYHYIPREGQSARPKFINTTLIGGFDFDDSELTYKKSDINSVSFSAPRDSLPQFFIDSRVQVRMTETMGMGCFANDDIPVNTIIESCPVILVHKDTFSDLNVFHGSVHKLSEYPFNWGRDGLCAFALGYGGIYNHKPFPNVAWRPNHEIQSIQYVTKLDVKKGSELFIRYLPLSSLENLWFYDEESEDFVKKRGETPKENMGIISTWKFR